jgi:GDP-L-fucose synthase
MGVEYSGDNSRLRDEIHGIKLTPIRDGISDLYDWYSRNMEKIDRNALLTDK